MKIGAPLLNCEYACLRFEALIQRKGTVLTDRDSTITRRQLGRYLREAREAVGLTIADAAALMEWGKSSLQRIETGQNQKIRIRDLDGLIEIYEIDEVKAAGLRGLAQQAAEKSWWRVRRCHPGQLQRLHGDGVRRSPTHQLPA